MTSRTEISLGPPAPRAAVVALVAMVAAILTAVVRYRPQEPTEPVTVLLRIPTEPPVAMQTAPVLIDAIPWGRIERIETLGGDLGYRLPEPRETPVLFDLPVGDWRITVSSPSSDEDRVCELTLAPDARSECVVEFERLSVDRYFQEAGWWR